MRLGLPSLVVSSCLVSTASFAQTAPVDAPPAGDVAGDAADPSTDTADTAAPSEDPAAATDAHVAAAPQLSDAELEALEEAEDAFEPDAEIQQYAAVTTRYTEPVQHTPASVAVVTRQQIERAGYRSVGEALASMPGVFVSYDLLNYHVALRGAFGGARAGSRYLKILIDGVPVPFSQSETYLLGPEFIPISTVERIEVLRGPASSLYGTGALVGAINVVTRRESYAGEVSVHGDVRANAGAGGVLAAGADGSVSVVGPTFYMLAGVAGAFEDRSGMVASREPSSTLADRYVDDQGQPLVSTEDHAYPAAAFLKGESNLFGGLIRGMAVAQLQARDAEFHDLSALSTDSQIRLANFKAGLSFDRPFAGGFTATGRIGLGAGTTLPDDQIRLSRADPFVIRRELYFFGVSPTAELRYDFGNGGYLLAGADGYYDLERLPRYVEVRDPSQLSGGEAKETERVNGDTQHLFNGAGYAHVVYPVFPWLRLAGGARVDYHSVYQLAAAARSGAVISLGDRFALKVLGGTAYKAPSPEQLYAPSIGLGTFDIYGNPDAKPQYLFGGETSLEYFPTTWLNLSAAAFYNYYLQALAYVATAGDLRATNYNAHSGGGEAAVRAAYTFDGGLRLHGCFTLSGQYTYVEETRIGGLAEKVIPDNEAVPNVVTNTQLGVDVPAMFSRFFVEYRWVGARTPSQPNLLANGTAEMQKPNYMLGDYHMLNVTWSTAPISLAELADLTLSLRATNLLGVPVPSGGTYQPLVRASEIGFGGVDVPMQGTTAWAGLRLAF